MRRNSDLISLCPTTREKFIYLYVLAVHVLYSCLGGMITCTSYSMFLSRSPSFHQFPYPIFIPIVLAYVISCKLIEIIRFLCMAHLYCLPFPLLLLLPLFPWITLLLQEVHLLLPFCSYRMKFGLAHKPSFFDSCFFFNVMFHLYKVHSTPTIFHWLALSRILHFHKVLPLLLWHWPFYLSKQSIC